MATFLFLRHGETEWNRLGKYTGQADIPLTNVGVEQASSLQEKMPEFNIAAVYSSDLKRAINTAKHALKLLDDMPIELEPRLREIDQGEWEGMHVDEIKERYAAEFESRKADPISVAPPGGESVGQVQSRVIAALRDIGKKHQGERVLISSHGLAIAVARVFFGNIPIEQVWDYVPANAEIITIDTDGTF